MSLTDEYHDHERRMSQPPSPPPVSLRGADGDAEPSSRTARRLADIRRIISSPFGSWGDQRLAAHGRSDLQFLLDMLSAAASSAESSLVALRHERDALKKRCDELEAIHLETDRLLAARLVAHSSAGGAQ